MLAENHWKSVLAGKARVSDANTNLVVSLGYDGLRSNPNQSVAKQPIFMVKHALAKLNFFSTCFVLQQNC